MLSNKSKQKSLKASTQEVQDRNICSATAAMPSPENSKSYPPRWENFMIALPHPYLTRYNAESQTDTTKGISYRIVPAIEQSENRRTQNPPFPLHDSALSFSSLAQGHDISLSDNTQWARARRSCSVTFTWTSIEPPSIAQLWLQVYALFTVYYNEDTIRLNLVGSQTDLIKEELVAVGLAISHPLPINGTSVSEPRTWEGLPRREILLLRSSFWQGAGSPFGSRSAWLPSENTSRKSLDTFPLLPATQTITTKFPEARVHALHPIRPRKPKPGSMFYSRYIPHLKEHFSMVALDYMNTEHLNLFHNWQNDPRVAAGWNEAGDLEHHRNYLKGLHEDPHVLTMLALFEDTPFAYFEVYWAKEDHLGTHYIAGDYDRGRHSLVGNPTFRGPHRAHAWWSSLMHYMFLDDPRTDFVVGEPKDTNERVLELDSQHGFHIEKFVDLPHKRSAFVKCSRERYFGLCTVGRPWEGVVREKEQKEDVRVRSKI